jgi:hypothetical protein
MIAETLFDLARHRATGPESIALTTDQQHTTRDSLDRNDGFGMLWQSSERHGWNASRVTGNTLVSPRGMLPTIPTT